jgi:hypothetical protein
MKFVLRYRPEVVVDVDAGRRWDLERSAGLGSDFIVECSEAFTDGAAPSLKLRVEEVKPHGKMSVLAFAVSASGKHCPS